MYYIYLYVCNMSVDVFSSKLHDGCVGCPTFGTFVLPRPILQDPGKKFICATVERHYIQYGHTLHRYRSSIFPIASHSPGALFLNASIRLRKIARAKIKS